MAQSSASAHGPKPKQKKNTSPRGPPHHAAFGPSRDPSASDPCPHLAKGKCVRGKTCNFSHDHLSAEAIRAIACQVVRRPNGACKAGVNCVYYHPDAEPGPSEMICGNAAEE